MSVENLQYLSSEQALADLATFSAAMTAEHALPEGTKWVSFGGSYPGSLSAWYRLKYPDMVHAAVSTSAPLIAQTDFLGKIHRCCVGAIGAGAAIYAV